VAHPGSKLCAALLVAVFATSHAPAQGLRLGVLGGTSDLTAGGWSLTTLVFPEDGPYAAGVQIGNRGAGAMIELFWRDERAPIAITNWGYLSGGVGWRFGPRTNGAGWGQWLLLGGGRILPARNRGMMFDIGLGVFGTLGGPASDGARGGLAGRALLGWVF
jgi:hypothetical protein